MQKINHYYFESIDTEYKAYILGFIFADGSIHTVKESIRNKNKEVYRIRERKRFVISIQKPDGYILEPLAEDLNVTIVTRNPPSTIKNNWQPQSKITVCSDSIFDDLQKLGCYPNKSTVGMDFPTLLPEFIPHFIRGFFDGDGSLGIKIEKNTYQRKSKYVLKNPAKPLRYTIRIIFSSVSKSFLEQIEKYLTEHTPCTFVYEQYKNKKCYNMVSYGITSTQNICNFLYKDASYFLERKKEKLNEFNMLIKSQAEITISEGLETT